MTKVIKTKIENYLLLSLIFASLISGFILANGKIGSDASAITISDSASIYASVSVEAACSLNALDNNDNGRAYSATLNPGTTTVVSSDPIYIDCNDGTGFDIYAIGFSNDSFIDNNTDLVSATNSNYNIKTNGASGASNWKMKISDDSLNTSLTIYNNYNDYNNIPSDYTRVASYASQSFGTDKGFVPSYQINASSSQQAGSYTGKVRYTIVHPNGASAPSYYLQGQSKNSMAAMMQNVGDHVVLLDKRDNTPYTIAKLPDGNYWMLDNLALDLVNVSLEDLKGNTNASDITLEYLKGIRTRDTSLESDNNRPTAGVMNWTSTDYSSYNYAVPQINTGRKNNMGTADKRYGIGSHKYGIYYNYCAASAGSYCFGAGTDYGGSVGDATEDICPSGWRLPTGGPTTGEYWQLCTALKGSDCATSGSESMTATDPSSLQYQLSTPLSGYWIATYGNAGTNGTFWTSTKNSNDYMYILNASASGVGAQDKLGRRYAFSIRCLFDLPN